MSVDPVNDSPAAFPVMVPPLLVKSTLLSAYAINGNTIASTARISTRLMTTLLNPQTTVNINYPSISGDRDPFLAHKNAWVTKGCS
jgi:hypothetical protein